MGGLWVDYNLQSTIPGLYVLGEANFSDHGANRLGASALMQGLADGYFVIPYTIGDHLARHKFEKVDENHSACQAALEAAKGRNQKLIDIDGDRSPNDFHKQLGGILWDHVGMARNRDGLETAIEQIRALRSEFWENLKITGSGQELNQVLEKAGRVADYMEFAELIAADALHREESSGGHFREEHQTPEGEARRDDENFAYVAAWEFNGVGQESTLHKEQLEFENVPLTTRSYK
jgi:succinate dehydrogenase / fumarate reductase flavoprotein subunit